MAKDFKNNKESASVSYAKTVSFFNFNSVELYSFEEQIFIANYDTIAALIDNFVIRKRQDSYFGSKIDTCMKYMLD